MVTLNFGFVEGLPDEEQQKLNNLVQIYNYHANANETKKRYYDGHIPLSEVNLGIALPRTMSKLDIGGSWGARLLTCWRLGLCSMGLFRKVVMKHQP